MIYIGIDPGKKGGIAVLDGEDAPVAYPYSDEILIDVLKAALCKTAKITAAVEKVGAMPGQGVTSMFTFGTGYGFIQGALSALSSPYQLVPPKKWKGEYSITADKKQSIEVCRRLFPTLELIPCGCYKEHDGMAEAALIAEYAKRNF